MNLDSRNRPPKMPRKFGHLEEVHLIDWKTKMVILVQLRGELVSQGRFWRLASCWEKAIHLAVLVVPYFQYTIWTLLLPLWQYNIMKLIVAKLARKMISCILGNAWYRFRYQENITEACQSSFAGYCGERGTKQNREICKLENFR